MKRFLIFIALLGGGAALWGWWQYQHSLAAPATVIGHNALSRLDASGEDAVLTFVVAGRDIKYTRDAGPLVYRDGRAVGRSYEARSDAYGTNTDTMLFGVLKGNDLKLIAIPRDIWLPEQQTKINAMYAYQQGEGLAREIGRLVGMAPQYYAVINIDIFKEVVDALGGIELEVPYRMCYRDLAAGLAIDFEPGLQKLDGEQTASFVRYRRASCGGAPEISDMQRLDNLKLVASAILARVRSLNLRMAGSLPELVRTYNAQIETNIETADMLKLLTETNLNGLELSSMTLPTSTGSVQGQINGEPTSISVERVNKREVDSAIAAFFGGTVIDSPETTQFSDVPVIIRNQSGVPAAGDYVKRYIAGLGVPDNRIRVLEETQVATSSQVRSEARWASQARHYAQVLHIGYNQLTSFRAPDGSKAVIEIVLAADMRSRYGLQSSLVRASTAAEGSSPLVTSSPATSNPSTTRPSSEGEAHNVIDDTENDIIVTDL